MKSVLRDAVIMNATVLTADAVVNQRVKGTKRLTK